jgi:hypothetical protein
MDAPVVETGSLDPAFELGRSGADPIHDKRAAESVAGRLHQPVKGRLLPCPTQQLHSP